MDLRSRAASASPRILITRHLLYPLSCDDSSTPPSGPAPHRCQHDHGSESSERKRITAPATETSIFYMRNEVQHRANANPAERDQQRVRLPYQRQKQRRAEPHLKCADIVQEVLVVRREERDLIEERLRIEERP